MKTRTLGARGVANGSIGAVEAMDKERVVSMGAMGEVGAMGEMGAMGELSFEVRSMMILGSFLGGLRVEDDALKAIVFSEYG